MTGDAWSSDKFGSDLTGALIASLALDRSAQALERAVAECAAAADAICADRPMACAVGCPHCCVLNVAILLPEGMVIAEWLRERLTPAALAGMRRALAAHRSWERWMDDEERIARKAVCPFVDAAGGCSIHPVRPLACRGVASLDRTSCRAAFNPIISDQERTVPADLLRRTAFDAAFAALARALRSHGLDDRSIEMGTGVLAFWERAECREMLLAGVRLPRELWE